MVSFGIVLSTQVDLIFLFRLRLLFGSLCLSVSFCGVDFSVSLLLCRSLSTFSFLPFVLLLSYLSTFPFLTIYIIFYIVAMARLSGESL